MLIAAVVAIIVYLILMIGAGFYAKRWVSDAGDYSLAGREFGGIVNTVELCAVALGGSLLTFVPSLVMGYGFLSAVIGYVVALGLGYCCYGLIYGKLARDNGSQTVAEYLELRYDSKVRTLVAIAASVTMLGITANNVLAIGSIFAELLGFSTIIVTSVCFIAIIAFSLLSGFWGITLTDMIQVVIGAIAFIGLAAFVMRQCGGFEWVAANFPSENWLTAGTKGMTIAGLSFKYPSYLTMFLNYMIFILWGSNYYFLRLNTCRNGKVGRNSYVVTGLIMIPVLLTPLAVIGAYAGAAHPDLFGMNGTLDGASAMSVVLKEVPVGLVILVLLGALSITVSTASTALIGVTSTLTRDIIQKRRKDHSNTKKELRIQRIVMLVLALIGWGLCFYPGGTVFLFGFATSWLGPVAILMILASFWPRFTNKGAFWGALVAMILLTLGTLLDVLGIFNVANYAHTSVIGLFSALIIGVIVSLVTKPNYYGRRGWKRKVSEGTREDVELNEFDKKVLAKTRYGIITMAEITDYFGCDSEVTKSAIEKLDRGGYIERQSLYSYKFYHLSITQKGKDALGKLTGPEEQLIDTRLSPEEFAFLAKAYVSHDEMQAYGRECGYGSLKMTAIISLLDHRGYVKQKGLMKRKVVLTQEGRNVVEAHKVLS